MSEYTISVERGEQNISELIYLYKEHFDQMAARMAADGADIGEFAMNVPEYLQAWASGGMINYVARKDGAAVGYCNMYLSKAMHTSQFVAFGDAIYVTPEHRNGLGRALLRYVMNDLRSRGVQSLTIGSATDMRILKLLRRMGFKELAVEMFYSFKGRNNV